MLSIYSSYAIITPPHLDHFEQLEAVNELVSLRLDQFVKMDGFRRSRVLGTDQLMLSGALKVMVRLGVWMIIL